MIGNICKRKNKKNILLLFLICSISAIVSNITLEIGEVPRTDRVSKLNCPKKGKCYWTTELVTTELSFIMKGTITDILAGVLASILLVIGEENGKPSGYFPWLYLSLRSLLITQGPSIARFGYAALPVENISAILFLILSAFLYAEEWSLWCEMANSCRILWNNRKSESLKKALKNSVNDIRTTDEDGKISRPKEAKC